MSETLKIRLAARCEAAGRLENEDNFQVAEDLSVSNVAFTTDKIFPLGNKGSLLLVCDGMGGMNAGEVASAIGVETIKSLFVSNLLTSEVFTNDESVCAYMKRAIVKADERIKEEAQNDSAKHGMGSTAVMAWLLGHKVYVAWCGDSRCYRYNPAMGLEQLSHDHSYVQDLVDTGQLSPDLAFDHPNKNIITRSLGDPRGAARPDAKVYDLRAGDVILLCSDGLCDSLRDNEIAQSINRSLASMAECRDTLWNDSKQAGWHDNVTVVLAQVVDENAMHTQPQSATTANTTAVHSETVQTAQQRVVQPTPETPMAGQRPAKPSSKLNSKVIAAIATAIILVIAGCCIWLLSGMTDNTGDEQQKTNGQELEEYKVLKNKLESVKFHEISDLDQAVDSIKKTVEVHYKRFVVLDEKFDSGNNVSDVKNIINQAIGMMATQTKAEIETPQEAEKKEKEINNYKIN